MFFIHSRKRIKCFSSTLRRRNMKTQQSQAAETLECTREHAHSKVLVEPTWLTALSFPPAFKLFRPSFWICVWGRLGQTNHVIIVTSWFSKSSVFKMFFVHTKTHSSVFKFLRFSRAFSKSSVLGGQFLRNRAPFSNSSGVVWTGPKTDAECCFCGEKVSTDHRFIHC